jgi:uncharacterized protein YdbL (DUF1318 family)
MRVSKVPEDTKWRAECDMRTLREAAEISADAKRVEAARKAAEEQIANLKVVTRTKVPKATPGKRLAGRKL